MISEPVLRLAVERAILSVDQAEALRRLANAEAEREFEPLEDREKLRFISGFGDIFVLIGIALFLGAAGYFLDQHFGTQALFPVLALLSWGLSEVFSRLRRMALPSIALLVSFSVFAFLGLASLVSGMSGGPFRGAWRLADHPAGLGVSALLTGALVWLHYRRFRVPITVAAGAGTAALAAFAFLTALAPALMGRLGPWVIFIGGVLIFLLAMRYDRSDLKRETRRTDIAFWLHLLAAPLIVHSFVMAVFGTVTPVSPGQASGLLALFGVLAVLALLIDRRAILVSALIYAGVAFGTLFRDTALANASLPATLLVLGAAILGLSAGWQPLRALLLAVLPQTLRAALPPAANQSST